MHKIPIGTNVDAGIISWEDDKNVSPGTLGGNVDFFGSV